MSYFLFLRRLFLSFALLASLVLATSPVSATPALTTLHSFLSSGANPFAAPLLGTDGTLYGTTYDGGANNNGTIYAISPGGVYTVLHTFSAISSGINADGARPRARLTLSSSGTILYGATLGGGANSNGTIFRINTDGTGFTALRSLTSTTDGVSIYSGLTLSSNGTALYGNTYSGGANGYGALFQINTDGTGFTVLRSLTSATDGSTLYGGLALSSNGSVLYGSAYSGGPNGYGTIFKINTDGTSFTVLRSLTSATDGGYPYRGVILSSNGAALYGTAYAGGPNSSGTIFKINTDGTSFTVLRSLTSTADGANPYGGLALSSNGAILYGAAYQGGANGRGTIFKINTDSTGFTVLQNCSLEPAYPQSPLLLLSQTGVTTLCGTSLKGGSGKGAIFGMTPAGSLTLTNTSNAGYYLCGGLTSDGNPTSTATLYGVSEYSTTVGTAGGYITSLTTAGGSAVNTGMSSVSTGAYTLAGLTRIGTNYYGVAMGGGANAKGTIFQKGTSTALYLFNTTDGAYPCGTMVPSADGLTLYGTTLQGGANGKGTVFSYVLSSSTLTTLYSFNTTDGAYPECGLALVGTTLYGTTTSGGANGKGTLFQVSTTGTGFADLHDFNTTDGRFPIAGPTVGSDGKLYGTTVYGGANDKGTAYSFNPSGGVFQSLYSFSGLDGSMPVGGLAEDPNLPGTFYGTTQYGGANNFGSVYSLVP